MPPGRVAKVVSFDRLMQYRWEPPDSQIFSCDAVVYGFLPTHILMESPSPGFGSITPATTFRSSDGDMLAAMEAFSVRAACTVFGKLGNGVDCRTGSDSVVLTCTAIPDSMHDGTYSKPR